MAGGKDKKDNGYVVLRDNRRKHLRKQILVLKIKGSDSRGAFFGYAKTFGRGGMFIASVNPRKVGEEFEISFVIPEAGGEIKCRCEVVWQREYDPKHSFEPGMGIRFIGLDDATEARIAEWLETVKTI
jgi:uncharacterized protein (TIGR02266 family)